MQLFKFIKEVTVKHPFYAITNIVLVFFVGILGTGTMFTLGPIVDVFIHPDLEDLSPLTKKAISFLKCFSLPVNLNTFLIFFLILITATSIMQVVVRYSLLKTKINFLRMILLESYEDIFNAKWYFFSSSKQGVLYNTFMRECRMVGDSFSAMAEFIVNIIQAVIFLAVPFVISWQVTLISLIVAVIVVFPFSLLGKLSYKFGKEGTDLSNEMATVITETFSLAKIYIGFGNQGSVMTNVRNIFDKSHKVLVKAYMLDNSVSTLFRPFAMIIIVIALFCSNFYKVPVSELTILLAVLFQVGTSIGELTRKKNLLQGFFPSYEQVNGLRKKAKEMRQKSGEIIFNGFKTGINIRNLYFAYPNNPVILNDINCYIAKGKTTAFVGKSGSGKSTLIDLIMGFHEPTRGLINFDGINNFDYDITSYRKRIGYVPQNSALFHMSIRDNLLWASPKATPDEIRQVCELTHVDEFVKKMPEGLDTIVGDRGVRLSGGQMQRIVLARAILRNPELLILDEATSSLDSVSEALVKDSINKLSKNYTIIIVAHRLSTIQDADLIYVLESGKIVESGTHQRLMDLNGQYRMYYDIQSKKGRDAVI
ncbi:MAG: ABC transporter ATP-binding protein [Candidatus Omnitrophica bacterium]|nr:ABC transporter ATP-binding protein [Candidatus Omnitrophota bacterium]